MPSEGKLNVLSKNQYFTAPVLSVMKWYSDKVEEDVSSAKAIWKKQNTAL